MDEEIKKAKQFCLDLIINEQAKSGEFKTYLYFPEKNENGWIYSGPSVFLTSCIAIELLNINEEKVKNIVNKAAGFVKSEMNEYGLWRFYPHQGLFKFNTPLDVDDTSLASFLLQKCNIDMPKNKEYLLSQIDRKGNFNIWFFPRFRFLRYPKLFFLLLLDFKNYYPILFPMKGRTNKGLVSYNDFEHAVSANALLYLGKSKETQKSINHLIEDFLFGNEHNQFFYPDELFTYYHISRLYKNGINDFENVKTKTETFILNTSFDKKNFLEKVLLLLTCKNYNIQTQLYQKEFQNLLSCYESELQNHFGYFCTKDRMMIGGSKAHVASLYLSLLI